MDKKEAIARGIDISATKHSMQRRNSHHNYYHRGTYMLTLVVSDRMKLLCTVTNNNSTSADNTIKPTVTATALGKTILNEEVPKIHRLYPMVEVWKVCLMPDHIHMIVRVTSDLPQGKHLGHIIRGFKTGCTRAWWRIMDSQAKAVPAQATGNTGNTLGKSRGHRGELGQIDIQGQSGNQGQIGNQGHEGAIYTGRGSGARVPLASPKGQSSPLRPLLFEPGYNDKILMREGQLENWKAYLDDNPRRLLVKRANPNLFTVLHNIELGGKKYQMVGNRFLLDIPDKMAVIVHRRYTDEDYARLTREWLACGERGGVLVSAAIAPREKAVLRQAMDLGHRIILLRENGFPELYKPSGESFDACSAGLLLQISPWEYHMDRKTITRSQCLELNSLAEQIAK